MIDDYGIKFRELENNVMLFSRNNREYTFNGKDIESNGRNIIGEFTSQECIHIYRHYTWLKDHLLY